MGCSNNSLMMGNLKHDTNLNRSKYRDLIFGLKLHSPAEVEAIVHSAE